MRVKARVPVDALATEEFAGAEVADGIEGASRFAEFAEFAEDDPYRAATHKKGIMNGVDPVVIATGNDWRGVEPGAHAFAQQGRYRPLATWRCARASLAGSCSCPWPSARWALRCA